MPSPDSVRIGNFYLSVLFIRQAGFCVAQALEYDIAAQGRDVEEAKRAFERTLIGQFMFDRQQGREPLKHLSRAPDRYWQAWREAAQQQLKTEPIHMPDSDIPPAFMVQAFSQAPVAV